MGVCIEDPTLRAKRLWKKTIRRQPLAKRLRWLKSDDAILAFPPALRDAMIVHIEQMILAILKIIPSASWYELAKEEGAEFPVPGMKLSRAAIRVGHDEVPTRRYLPKVGRRVEEMLDAMDVLKAAFYHYPPSVTGIQFLKIARYRGSEEKKKLRTRKPGKKPPQTECTQNYIFASAAVEITYGEKGVQFVAK